MNAGDYKEAVDVAKDALMRAKIAADRIGKNRGTAPPPEAETLAWAAVASAASDLAVAIALGFPGGDSAPAPFPPSPDRDPESPADDFEHDRESAVGGVIADFIDRSRCGE